MKFTSVYVKAHITTSHAKSKLRSLARAEARRANQRHTQTLDQRQQQTKKGAEGKHAGHLRVFLHQDRDHRTGSRIILFDNLLLHSSASRPVFSPTDHLIFTPNVQLSSQLLTRSVSRSAKNWIGSISGLRPRGIRKPVWSPPYSEPPLARQVLRSLSTADQACKKGFWRNVDIKT